MRLEKQVLLPRLLREVIVSLFKRPSTKEYPFEKLEVPETLRGKMHVDFDKCISCGLCSRNCPSKAIELVEVSGKKAPCFHFDTCVFCYLCVEVCPRNAILPSNAFELATMKKSNLEVPPSPNPSSALNAPGGN